MPVEHYENFPVASLLMPAHLREPVEAIYAFARSADDIADEGEVLSRHRLAQLNDYRVELDRIERGDTSVDPMFARLARNVHTHALPVQLLRDLLDAFSQDVVKKRYADFPELLDYCRRSANPVGRLLLHLYGHTSATQLARSDSICSALQLINFWQDVAVDWRKNRVYLPQDSLARFHAEEAQIDKARVDEHWRALMRFEVDRARAMLLGGAPLALELPGRIGWELRLVVQGGLRILERIEAVGYDVFRHRPQLGKADWLLMAWRALRMTRGATPSSADSRDTQTRPRA
ncbi:squalene synthase HpnC [Uliginosibacterium sp. H1]|uniref:squalene synthase HpnC n=1 Tax=Uliginosibacterium sp. H1 TaxID=3114757 RepID=UPI002E191239|nr:squalene synthase HpnC [Uliginosibacterium sp. H1]